MEIRVFLSDIPILFLIHVLFNSNFLGLRKNEKNIDATRSTIIPVEYQNASTMNKRWALQASSLGRDNIIHSYPEKLIVSSEIQTNAWIPLINISKKMFVVLMCLTAFA